MLSVAPVAVPQPQHFQHLDHHFDFAALHAPHHFPTAAPPPPHHYAAYSHPPPAVYAPAPAPAYHQPAVAMPHRQPPERQTPPQQPPHGGPWSVHHAASIAQALEVARESEDGAQEEKIRAILDGALADVWGRVQARPDAYVMTRDEFAVFNYFQHRFAGNKVAVAARKRYWDNMRA